MSHEKLFLKGIPRKLLFWRTILKWTEQGGLFTRGVNQENHPFLVKERSGGGGPKHSVDSILVITTVTAYYTIKTEVALSRGWKGRTSPPKNWEDLPPLEKNINKGQVLVRVTWFWQKKKNTLPSELLKVCKYITSARA